MNTDVLVLAIAMFNLIKADEQWVAFDSGSNFITVHQHASAMDPRICATLPIFYAWNTRHFFPVHAFEEFLLMQGHISGHTKSVLEWFVVLLYDWTSNITMVNATRNSSQEVQESGTYLTN